MYTVLFLLYPFGTFLNLNSPLLGHCHTGYRSVPLEGAPFDSKQCVVPTKGGVVHEDLQREGARLYASGWVKRGPTGVILSTMNDAYETGDSVCVGDMLFLPCPIVRGALLLCLPPGSRPARQNVLTSPPPH